MNETKLTKKEDQIIKYKIWLERANLKIIKLENQIKKLKEENK